MTKLLENFDISILAIFQSAQPWQSSYTAFNGAGILSIVQAARVLEVLKYLTLSIKGC